MNIYNYAVRKIEDKESTSFNMPKECRSHCAYMSVYVSSGTSVLFWSQGITNTLVIFWFTFVAFNVCWEHLIADFKQTVHLNDLEAGISTLLYTPVIPSIFFNILRRISQSV